MLMAIRRPHNSGFSLLELLLVLVCMAAILAWAMHHYQTKERRAQALQVEADIKTWQRALDSYFHITGCDNLGNFSGPLTVECQTLQGINSNIVCSRSPLVAQYAAVIIKTDQTATGMVNKPIYQLEVQAVLVDTLTAGQITWYQQELNAKPSTGNRLVWDALPANSSVQAGDDFYILNGAGALFRATENQNGAGGEPLPSSSGSFCAN